MTYKYAFFTVLCAHKKISPPFTGATMPRKPTQKKSQGSGRGSGSGRGRGCGRGGGRGRGAVATRTKPWHILKPTVVSKRNPKAKRARFRPFDFDDAGVRHDAQFVLPEPQPRKSDVPSVVMALNVNYYPDAKIEEWWENTLKHVDSKLVPFRDRYNINRGDILHFLTL